MKDTGVKIKIDIEGLEEIKALRNELEALAFLVDGVEKCTSKFIEKYETLKKIAPEDEAKKLDDVPPNHEKD
mgnify:FL=1